MFYLTHLLLRGLNFILDIFQFQLHCSLFLLSVLRSCLGLFNENVMNIVDVMFDFYCHVLLHCHMDLGTINFALSVVHMHDGPRCLKRSVDILLKLRLKGRKPLANAAASFNLLFLEKSFARLKCYGFLADNQNLL